MQGGHNSGSTDRGPGPKAFVKGRREGDQPLDLHSLEVALAKLEDNATKFWTWSRPLLDNGDGKLAEGARLLDKEAAHTEGAKD